MKSEINIFSQKIIKSFYQSLADSSPERLITKKKKYNNQNILFNNKNIYKLLNNEKFYFVALGKASQSLSSGFLRLFKDKVIDYLVIKHFDKKKFIIKKKNSIISTHPLVSIKSYKAAKKLLKFIKKIPKKSNILFLISGGGSAMLAHPLPGLNFNKKSNFINNLIKLGIGEREVNYFRKSLSSIKSSKLLNYFDDANILNLILSDERQNKIDAISSGLTVPQKRNKININLFNYVTSQEFCSKEIKIFLKKNNYDYPKNNYGNKVKTIIIGDRNDLVFSITKYLENNFITNRIKYYGHIFEPSFEEATKKIFNSSKKFYNNQYKGNNFLIFTGEIPVKANLNSKGGRNQHLSAYFIDKFKNFKNFSFCCFSTDGCDFVKGVHGAYIDNNIVDLVLNNRINYNSYIKETNTYYLHKITDSLIKGNYSDNNLSDFYIFAYRKK